MSKTTNIEWADSTFNPWRGCSKVSPGCAHCYITSATPLRVAGYKHGQPRIRAGAATWRLPHKWNVDASNREVRPRIFPSLMDWLDADVPIDWLADFLKLIYETPNLDWLLLTKRPENFRPRILAACDWLLKRFQPGDFKLAEWASSWLHYLGVPRPPKNVWIGVSVEDQKRADERIPQLLEIPAVARFLSMEPLLEAVDLKFAARSFGFPKHITKENRAVGMPQGIDWVIIGGESDQPGQPARPCNTAWIESILTQCRRAGVTPFVKQLGSNAVATLPPTRAIYPLNLKHKKGGDMTEWADELVCRQFPEVVYE